MASPAQTSSAPQWQQPPAKLNTGGELRSVTPAMNNTRGAGRNPSYPSRVPSPTPGAQYAGRMPSPQRYYHGQNGFDVVNPNANANANAKGGSSGGTGTANNNGATLQQQQQQQQQQQLPQGPSSTGLIRLTLRKPMGIVFEPMYDPNQPSVQRGVRICDLPRTGAAALSRRLEIGDELLSINDKTMSRLTFDEIMDFIIEADPEQVNLLFRRPRKEVLAARNAIHHGALAAAAASGPKSTSVKWVDEDSKKAATVAANDKSSSKKASKKESSSSRNKKTASRSKSDDDTLETYEEDSRRGSSRKKGRGSNKRDPYENESFLDLLIDTICANPDAVCKTRGDEEYYSDEDDRTLTSYDDSTYVTYESEIQEKKKSSKDIASSDKKRAQKAFDSETEEDTYDDRRRSTKKDAKKKDLDTKHGAAAPSGKYEDDQTLETIETRDRPLPPVTASPSPLGLAAVQKIEHAPPVPLIVKEAPAPAPPAPMAGPAVGGVEDKNKAPILELEYDDLIDHAADVSVMESLGGPSLLIEKQRQAAFLSKTDNAVPAEIINEFGSNYPAAYGMTREQTIHRDPIKFYSFVVELLLEQHEPEKVRLLDKLLAKYKGREDHLVQKLSVRYKRGGPDDDAAENAAFGDFTDAVNTKKESPATEVAVQKAQERAAAAAFAKWPDKETKEAEPVDLRHQQQDEESDDESEFSGDSIDGTSPAVIAQVSELLNYVYGKTSVPGQIDRVSTIMRAYEGREAVLLELLETKALIKANSEKENAANLPSFLRNSPALHGNGNGEAGGDEADLASPLSSPNRQNQQQQGVGGNIINDDISSMSGVSSPAPENGRMGEPPSLSRSKSSKEQSNSAKEQKKSSNPTSANAAAEAAVSTPPRNEKKKKKFLGGLFGKKNKKDKTRIRKGGKGDGEGSI